MKASAGKRVAVLSARWKGRTLCPSKNGTTKIVRTLAVFAQQAAKHGLEFNAVLMPSNVKDAHYRGLRFKP